MKNFVCLIIFTLSLNIFSQDRLIFDVRTLPEWEQKKLENIQLVEWQNLLSRLDNMNVLKDHEILLFCRSGNRSGKAKKILEENGFTNVKNLGSIEMASKFLNQPIIINNK